MIRNLHGRKAVRFAVCGALALTLATGCAGSGHMARASKGAPQTAAAKTNGKLDRAVANAEGVVAKYPLDAGARAALGGAYLDAGRFESAAVTFQDAIALGDDGAGTALRLALAQIGAGRGRQAVAVLEQHGAAIPASDLGLALALAGDTSRGVAILNNALRGGEDTPKLRQNLAYAFALDGHWLEARLLAAQDVPADKLDARMNTWAMHGRPEDYQQRVAGLLGAPVRADQGQPVELALGDRSAPASAPAPQLARVEASGELPALEPDHEFVRPEPAPFVAAAIEAPAPAAAAATPAPVPFVAAATVAPVSEAPATDWRPAYPLPMAAQAAPRTVSRKVAPKAAPVVARTVARGGTHQVQLGSFSSEENARRAKKILRDRNPELASYEFVITPAVVRGKNFWRVSVVGFDQRSAAGLCSKVRTRGGACLAYAVSSPLPGRSPGKGGTLMARR